MSSQGFEWAGRVGLALVAVAAWGLLTSVHAAESNGARFYQRDCARCHGPHGHGDGPDAAIFPEPPRDLRADFITKYSDAELVRRVRRGSPLQLTIDPAALRAREHDVAVVADYIRRLPTIDWARVELGRDVYADRCVSCHGVYGHPAQAPAAGKGDALATHDLSDATFQSTTTDERLRGLVIDGHAPALRARLKLTASETAAVVVYLRLLSPGYELFSRFCSNCHGDTGHPGPVPADTTTGERPTLSFDEAYFAKHDSAYVRDRIWHMIGQEKPHMPHLRHEVSETAAAAIIQFLKGLRD